ncbi:hypothetical protein B0H94_102174 [Salsuginibacillus halophilus]|uniref:Uncharacterized protein n=1 Tax=Salsuginibacillus halophilus TaxID=517424 RepID=A0A2P8HXG1_9BACI|nr:hypothetical protein [Salsuginibacillus halophilus]PSL50897.1 hypothetical protein B0H94_102174 [Salsuginibacillus halophilus]
MFMKRQQVHQGPPLLYIDQPSPRGGDTWTTQSLVYKSVLSKKETTEKTGTQPEANEGSDVSEKTYDTKREDADMLKHSAPNDERLPFEQQTVIEKIASISRMKNLGEPLCQIDLVSEVLEGYLKTYNDLGFWLITTPHKEERWFRYQEVEGVTILSLG